MPEERRDEDLQSDSEGKEERPEVDTPDVEEIQAELAQLRRQVDEHEVANKARQHRGRAWAVGLLIALGLILLAAGNVTFWLRGTVLNTNRWVAAVGPLTSNETVANALSAYVVGTLFELFDADQAIAAVLPSEYSFLGGGLARVAEDLAQDTATSLIQSDQFNAVWVGFNRAAHQAVMGVLRGGGDLLYLRDGELTIDLSDAFNFLAGSLGLGDAEFLQGVQTRFVILQSHQVAMVQQVLGLIDAVGLLIPLLALVCLVAAWFLSLWRRRTVLWIGAGVAIAMVVSLGLFAIAQPLALPAIADPLVRLLAGEIWDVVIRGLYVQTIIVLVVGLLIAAGAALAGPSPRAVAIRNGVGDGWDKLTKRED